MKKSKEDIKHITIGERKIVINGIGRKFYSEGYPISLAIEDCMKLGAEVSIFHLVDELLKHGWSSKTVISKFKEEQTLDINKVINIKDVEVFCSASYEDQRELIFNYLFKNKKQAKEYLLNL